MIHGLQGLPVKLPAILGTKGREVEREARATVEDIGALVDLRGPSENFAVMTLASRASGGGAGGSSTTRIVQRQGQKPAAEPRPEPTLGLRWQLAWPGGPAHCYPPQRIEPASVLLYHGFMPIRFPSAQEAVDALKNSPGVLLMGLVSGTALGLAVGTMFASSGKESITRKAELLEKERDSCYSEREALREGNHGLQRSIETSQSECASIVADRESAIQDLDGKLRVADSELDRLRRLLASAQSGKSRQELAARAETDAARSEKYRLEAQNSELTQRLSEAAQEKQALKQKVVELSAPARDPGVEGTRMLVYLYGKRGRNPTEQEMARAMGLDRGLVEYHLERLRQMGLVEITGGFSSGQGSTRYWELSQAGIRYVIENKLSN